MTKTLSITNLLSIIAIGVLYYFTKTAWVFLLISVPALTTIFYLIVFMVKEGGDIQDKIKGGIK